VGAALARAIELHVRATGDLLDRFYDFDLDHWGIPAVRGVPLALYVQQVATSPMFRGTDNGAYSLTIQALFEQNATCATHPGTHYFSYVTEQTTRGLLSGHHYPEVTMNPLMIPSALYIGHATYAKAFYPGFRAEEWWHNDGLVPVFSQMYPRIAGNHPVGGEIGSRQTFDRGRWYHQTLSSMDHIDIVAIPQLDHVGDQRRFYRSLFARLASL
jgi:triacylglycerol lipase